MTRPITDVSPNTVTALNPENAKKPPSEATSKAPQSMRTEQGINKPPTPGASMKNLDVLMNNLTLCRPKPTKPDFQGGPLQTFLNDTKELNLEASNISGEKHLQTQPKDHEIPTNKRHKH